MRIFQHSPVVLMLACACSAGAQPSADSETLELSEIRECLYASNRNAEEALTAAIRWADRSSEFQAEQCLSFVYMDLGEEDLAIAALVRAAERAEAARSWRAASLWSQSGSLAFMAGRRNEALGYFDRAFQSPELDDDMRGEIFATRATSLILQRDFVAAERDLAEARRLTDYNMEVWIMSADLALARGDRAAGAEYLTRAYEIDPTDAAIAFRAGEIAFARGAFELAQQAWGRAMELEPNGSFGLAAARRLRALADPELPRPQG